MYTVGMTQSAEQKLDAALKLVTILSEELGNGLTALREDLGDDIRNLHAMLGTRMDAGFAAVADDISDLKERIPTDDDLQQIVRAEVNPLFQELSMIRRDLDGLHEKFENVIAFRKEIDHALERIGAIEKHLGIARKIAA